MSWSTTLFLVSAKPKLSVCISVKKKEKSLMRLISENFTSNGLIYQPRTLHPQQHKEIH